MLCGYTIWEKEIIAFEITEIPLNDTEFIVKAYQLLITLTLMGLHYCLAMSALCKLSPVCGYFHWQLGISSVEVQELIPSSEQLQKPMQNQ